VTVTVDVDTPDPATANQSLRPTREVEAKSHRGDKIRKPHPQNHRGGDVILVGPMTEVDPVSKGGDHIQGESVEQAERHLSITTTPWSVLDGNDSAKEEEDDGEVGESLFREAAEGRDDDPDVRTKEGNKYATVISRMPCCFCLLAVAQKSVEGSTVDHAHLIGEELKTSCN